MKDYYAILGVDSSATEDVIRKKYRKMAMEYHPDKNPDNPQAEEKFKEIAEAYGVLTDPVKRKKYDLFRASGATRANQQGGFSYSQEDILKDLFRDPRFQQMFQGILREFQRSGLRASPHFLKRAFFGGKGGFVIGGLFLFGSLAGPALAKKGKDALPGGRSLLRSIGNSIGNLLGRKDIRQISQHHEFDIIYRISVSENEIQQGKWTEVVSTGGGRREVLRVKIPPGSRFGQKLRLKGKGKKGPLGRGDMYLQLDKK